MPSPIRPRIHARQRGQLGGFGPVPDDRRLRPGRACRGQPLGATARGEQSVGQLEHFRRRPVVVGQRHDPRIGEPAGEPGQERARRAGERVDGLVLVADDAHVLAVAEPELEQPLLVRVRVLVLVDAEPALPGADRRGRVRIPFEQVDRLDEQIVEVDPSGARLGALVAGEQADEQVDRDRRLARRRRRATGDGALVRGRCQSTTLRPLDLVGEVLRRGEPIVAGQRPGQRHQQRDLRIEDGRQRVAAVGRAARSGGAG